MPRRIVPLLVALVSLGALVAAPAALAKKKGKAPKPTPVLTATGTASTSVDNQPAVATAVCPPGKVVVGGGFASPTVVAGGNVTDLNLIHESRRLTPTSWEVSAVREDTGGAGPTLTLTAFAYCRTNKLKQKASAKKKKKKKLNITETSATSPPAGSAATATANAVCPGKQKALSGGFSSSPQPVLSGTLAFPIFHANFRSAPNAWTAGLVNSGSTPRTVTSFVYCSSSAASTQTTQTAALGASAPGAIVSATATTPACPKSRSLIGGGFNDTPASGGGPIAILTDSKAAGRQWTHAAFNLGTSPGSITALGYCL